FRPVKYGGFSGHPGIGQERRGRAVAGFRHDGFSEAGAEERELVCGGAAALPAINGSLSRGLFWANDGFQTIKVGVVNVSVAGCKIEMFEPATYQSYVSNAPP